MSFHGVYTGLALLLAPFFWLWNAIPVAHPQVGAMLGMYYFHPSVEAFLLTFAIKLPILIFDVLAGVFVFFLVRDITGSAQSGGKAFLFWYLNPFNVFMIEMWGSMDVIPAAFVVLAVLLALRKRWVSSGLTLSLATLLRIFPLLLLPAFLLYWIRKCSSRMTVGFMISFLAPLVAALYVLLRIFGSVEAIVSSFVGIAFGNAWLLRFYGIIVVPGIQGTFDRLGVPLALFLYPLQLYVATNLWKRHRIDSLVLAFLLIHFTATTYEPYHFTWITPMLAVYYGIDRRRFRPLAILFVAAFLAMYTYANVSTLGHTIFLIPAYTAAMQRAALIQYQIFPQVHAVRAILHGCLSRPVRRLSHQTQPRGAETLRHESNTRYGDFPGGTFLERIVQSRLVREITGKSSDLFPGKHLAGNVISAGMSRFRRSSSRQPVVGRIDQAAVRRFQETHQSDLPCGS